MSFITQNPADKLFQKKSLTVPLVIIVVMISSWYIFKHLKSDNASVSQNFPNIQNEKWNNAILSDITKSLKSSGDISVTKKTGNDFLLWKKQGYLVYLSTRDSIRVNSKVSTEVRNTQDIYNNTSLGEVFKKVTDSFKKNGFTLSVENSTTLGDFDYAQAYNKDNTFCSVIISSELVLDLQQKQKNAEIKIACANNLDPAFKEQKTYLDLLKLKEKGFAIQSVKISGNFYAIGVIEDLNGGGFRLNGANYILKLDGIQYKIIDGPRQDIPLCKNMDELKIPRELYDGCYDSNGVLRS